MAASMESTADGPAAGRDFPLLWLAWLALSGVLTILALRNLSAPGLYYDEAVFGHFAKDFLTVRTGDQTMPASQVVSLFGRPFPLFVQGYLGALKCWMLLPALAAFGCSVAVTRLTMLAWTLAGLLIFMLWTRRLLGSRAAVVGGFLLGLDPSFYFISVCDWGSVVPSFVCRFAGFFFALRWWQERRARDLFFAGLALGLGFFNKIDFVLILAGCGAALLAVYRVDLWEAARQKPSHAAWGAAGLLVGAGPMAMNFLIIGHGLFGGSFGSHPGDAIEKAGTLRAMFDGSYFFRLMDHGGHFDRMFGAPSAVWGPFGLVFALAFVLLGIVVLCGGRRHVPERLPAFLLIGTALVLLGTWLLPGAVRLHHWTLVYPLPHVVVLAAAVRLWRRKAGPRGIRALAVLAVAAVLCGHLLAIQKTQSLIAGTGGRGLWSNAFDAFASEVRTRKDLTIVSYDWGFHEQLAFLTDGPKLLEPIWAELPAGRFVIPTSPNVIHLIHPPEDQVFPLSGELLRRIAATDPKKVSVRACSDRTGRTAFYAIRFLGG